jgi:hypothetical protein
MAGRSGIDWYKRREAKSPLKVHNEEADKPFEETTIFGWNKPPNQAHRNERKLKVYIHNCDNVEWMLTAVNQFNQVKATLHLRNDELFTSFSRTLKQGAQPAKKTDASGYSFQDLK